MGNVRSTDEIRKRRGQMRHNAEQVGAGGFILFIFSLFGDHLTGTQAAWLVAGSTAMLNGVAKAWSENDIGARLINRFLPGINSLLVVVALTSYVALGCAGHIGISTPMEVTGGDGDPIIAHEVKGVSWAFWDGAVGSNIEGGTGGQETVGVIGQLANAAASVIGGFFTGLGGIGAAITPEPD